METPGFLADGNVDPDTKQPEHLIIKHRKQRVCSGLLQFSMERFLKTLAYKTKNISTWLYYLCSEVCVLFPVYTSRNWTLRLPSMRQ